MDTLLTEDAAWAASCTQTLTDCVNMGAVAGSAEWLRLRAQVPEEKHPRIWNADYSKMDLTGFNLSRCKLRDVKMNFANLSETSFWQSILRNCDLTGANVNGADFGHSDVAGSVLRRVQFDDRTSFAFMAGRVAEDIDILLRERAENDMRLAEFMDDPTKRSFHKLMVAAIDSVRNLIIYALFVILAFSLIFQTVGYEKSSWDQSVIYSTQYFIALNDPFSEKSRYLSYIGTAEACLGLVFLALLLASISKHISVRR